ncbi:glycoside hydrolase family 13 protein [Tenacibaculum sp. M341]|uniref:glycoside hydrolase family 13 protein n=1 Tax=Tenacibaculum sp. M341 TaxID=2530339 RepID=UPI00104E1946|nr:glycoside hydrolase family 13 protein [Tenacibaculum sp. M341]TCI94941.1 alpha-amlyase [Tenacibaculum sp. M341]
MKRLLIFSILLFLFSCVSKEENKVETPKKVEVSNTFLERVEPPNWWIGFKDTSLQLLVKEENISKATPKIEYQGVSIQNITKGKSPNYLFLDLVIEKTTSAGKFDIVFSFENGTEKKHTYELKKRTQSSEQYTGFNSTDAIYLITPDRFANGDTSNDIVTSLKEKEIDRMHDYKRHGGDIQGIINHLDYIENLGFTSIWPTPLLTNDMYQSSYHGYAITDYYQVDPRFGSLEDYKNLAKKMKKRNMKLIMDQVANHCGLEHWWMKDLPFEDWVNYQENYEKNKGNWKNESLIPTNHRRTTNQDFYAAEVDKNAMSKGWFVKTMPDLNQRNPFMANYIIQNSIWWIETLQLGGIRQDTYPYPDKEFMSKWAGSIMNEYPNFSIVGEEWSYNPLLIAYWQRGKKNKDGYESNLKSTMDFAVKKSITEALNESENWNTGLIKMYEALANDFAYVNPNDLLVFLDNHDENRIFTSLKENITNTKMSLSYMLVLPRIPQIYYGTEILKENSKRPGDHGLIRSDFPGGWENDSQNAFTTEGLSESEKDMQSYLRKILNYRKNSKAIHKGKTIHFAPENGTYVLARIIEGETVLHIINKNESPIILDLERFKELNIEGKKLKNIITEEVISLKDTIELNKKGSIILTTKLN